MVRPYTGYDGDASGERAGMEEFVKLTVKHFNGGVWKNGTWGIRNQNRPGSPKKSVHSTGRAADISWQRDVVWQGKKVGASASAFGDHQKALQVADFWLDNADLFLIEELHDYYPQPFGRGWRCTRGSWTNYKTQTIGNTPGGTWFHVEIAPAHADDAGYYQGAFAQATGGPAPSPAAGAVTSASGKASDPFVAPPGVPELTTAEESIVKPAVMKLQQILIDQRWAVFTNVDGQYGDKTCTSVKAMQGDLGFTGTGIDGRYGKNTAQRLQTRLDSLV